MIPNCKKNSGAVLAINSDYIGDVDINNVSRYGNVVRVDFRGKLVQEIPNNTTFLTLPFRPNKTGTIQIGIGGRYEFSEIKWAYFDSNGDIKDGVIAKDQYIHINFTYICKN